MEGCVREGCQEGPTCMDLSRGSAGVEGLLQRRHAKARPASVYGWKAEQEGVVLGPGWAFILNYGTLVGEL